MALDIPSVQQALAAERLDGWLLYDFHGSNPIAVRLAGLTGAHTTRRWYYFIPARGEPVRLVHAIEPWVLDSLPGRVERYAGRRQLVATLEAVLAGHGRVAMEYSPECAIPDISRVDAGTVDLVRRIGVTVVSSGDLVGRFEAAWDMAARASHADASGKLHDIKDRAFALVSARLAGGSPVHEFEVQQAMLGWFAEAGLVTDAPPIVATREHSGDPHYTPDRSRTWQIEPGDLLLIDLWGKLDRPGAVYADITWTGQSGTPPADVQRVFEVVTAARDAALARVQSRVGAGEAVRGWEVDRAARDVIADAGFGDQFIHRTGHSLGEDVHGTGVHMDDYETHDDRRLLQGTGFTIEPGIYTPRFGNRSEINVIVGPQSARATGPCQTALVPLAAGPPG
jgi:Xaa-Pro dipeptidase